jgi:putative transcriptional regulator
VAIKNRLREIIEQRGIKQKFLADQSGVNEQTLSNCINNRFNLSLENAIKIAKVLNMPVEELFIVEDE